MSKCVVVTICETVSAHCNDVDTVVFSDWNRAESWIETRIESQVKTFGLDCERAVDGWCVEIDGSGHTIQYDAKERIIKRSPLYFYVNALVNRCFDSEGV